MEDEECNDRIVQAVYAHVNMIASGILEALGEDTLSAVLNIVLRNQRPNVVKAEGLERPKEIDRAIEIVNKAVDNSRIFKVYEDEETVHIEDEMFDKEAIRRARENFGAFTNFTEAILLFYSRALVTGYKVKAKLLDGGRMRVIVYKKRSHARFSSRLHAIAADHLRSQEAH